MGKLVVYVTKSCPHARKQLEEFDEQGLDYQVVDLDEDLTALLKVKEEFNANRVPVVEEGGKLKFMGYNGGMG